MESEGRKEGELSDTSFIDHLHRLDNNIEYVFEELSNNTPPATFLNYLFPQKFIHDKSTLYLLTKVYFKIFAYARNKYNTKIQKVILRDIVWLAIIHLPVYGSEKFSQTTSAKILEFKEYVHEKDYEYFNRLLLEYRLTHDVVFTEEHYDEKKKIDLLFIDYITRI